MTSPINLKNPVKKIGLKCRCGKRATAFWRSEAVCSNCFKEEHKLLELNKMQTIHSIKVKGGLQKNGT